MITVATSSPSDVLEVAHKSACCLHGAAAEKMRAALVEMKKAAGDDEARNSTAWLTLLKLIGNVAHAPQVEKFRRIKVIIPTPPSLPLPQGVPIWVRVDVLRELEVQQH